MPRSLSTKSIATILIAFGTFSETRADFEHDIITLVASIDDRHQTIEGFGASDAWNADFVGKFWSEQEKAKMAERLFSTEFDDNGSPLGIGLSIWRFNVGAGSAAQGDSSQIRNPTRRTESFLNADGSYDWNRQAGQQWFLNEANRYGVETLIAFSNSPPVTMTRDRIAHGSGGFNSILLPEKRDDFAGFLCDIIEHFEAKGIDFDFVSPINEPQYQWKTTKQEGSPWTNREVFEMTRSLDRAISERDLNTKILVPEAADWRNLYELKGQNEHSFQLEAFYDSQSPTYIGNFETVDNRFAVHSYWTNRSESEILETRHNALQIANRYGVQLHQTEYSLIALDRVQNDRPSNGWEVAQFIAKIIHFDLTEANVTSWSFWTAMAEEAGEMNRYLLLKLKPETSGDLTSGGGHIASKNLFALGHYSLFVRPGYQRVSINPSRHILNGPEQDLLASAYWSERNSEGVFVISNLSRKPIELSLSWKGGCTPTHSKTYLSNSENSLIRNDSILSDRVLTIPAKSLVTIVDSY